MFVVQERVKEREKYVNSFPKLFADSLSKKIIFIINCLLFLKYYYYYLFIVNFSLLSGYVLRIRFPSRTTSLKRE